MAFLIQTHDFIILGIGICIGWLLKAYIPKVNANLLLKIIIGSIVFCLWILNNIYGDGSNIFLNLLVGVLVAHFFELQMLKEKLIGLIGTNNEGKSK